MASGMSQRKIGPVIANMPNVPARKKISRERVLLTPSQLHAVSQVAKANKLAIIMIRGRRLPRNPQLRVITYKTATPAAANHAASRIQGVAIAFQFVIAKLRSHSR